MIYDVIVIGGSLGALEALQHLLAELPADLPAAVFVVIHMAPDRRSRLPEVIAQYGSMAASAAVHGERIRKGHIYVAPSDNHLSLQGEYVRVVRGPRENGHRPAVDVLFRSAAREFGPRVIGVVLSGQLDCGTEGMMAVRARGGLTVVQEPAEATFPEMPRSVLEHMPVDHALRAEQIGLLLARLAGTEVPKRRIREASSGASGRSSKLQEAQEEVMSGERGAPTNPGNQDIRMSPISCPECQGSMVEIDEEGLERFRCHVGHAFSLDSLAVEQERATEDALWAAVRALDETETLARRMAERSERSLSARFLERAEAMKQHAETIRRMLLSDGIVPSARGEEAGIEQ